MKTYETPEAELVRFTATDILTDSDSGGGDNPQTGNRPGQGSISVGEGDGQQNIIDKNA